MRFEFTSYRDLRKRYRRTIGQLREERRLRREIDEVLSKNRSRRLWSLIF